MAKTEGIETDKISVRLCEEVYNHYAKYKGHD